MGASAKPVSTSTCCGRCSHCTRGCIAGLSQAVWPSASTSSTSRMAKRPASRAMSARRAKTAVCWPRPSAGRRRGPAPPARWRPGAGRRPSHYVGRSNGSSARRPAQNSADNRPRCPAPRRRANTITAIAWLSRGACRPTFQGVSPLLPSARILPPILIKADLTPAWRSRSATGPAPSPWPCRPGQTTPRGCGC